MYISVCVYIYDMYMSYIYIILMISFVIYALKLLNRLIEKDYYWAF